MLLVPILSLALAAAPHAHPLPRSKHPLCRAMQGVLDRTPVTREQSYEGYPPLRFAGTEFRPIRFSPRPGPLPVPEATVAALMSDPSTMRLLDLSAYGEATVSVPGTPVFGEKRRYYPA